MNAKQKEQTIEEIKKLLEENNGNTPFIRTLLNITVIVKGAVHT